MWKTLLGNWFKAPLTTAYPARPEAAPERFRGLLTVHPENCNDLAACMRVCPTGAITIEDDPELQERRFWIDYSKCIFCGLCVEGCGKGVISMCTEYEAASRRKEDLRVQHVSKLAPDEEVNP